jgi:hypothetical protein
LTETRNYLLYFGLINTTGYPLQKIMLLKKSTTTSFHVTSNS